MTLSLPRHGPVLLLAALVSAAGCSDSTGPRQTTGGGALLPLEIGDTAVGYLAAADPVGARYAVHVAASGEIAVFFQAEAQQVEIILSDSASGTPRAVAYSSGDYARSHLLHNRTPTLTVSAGQTILLEVQHRQSPGTAGRYRIYVYPVNRAPEHVPVALVLGDTVTGEILDNPADVDEFTYTPAGAEEVIGYLIGSGTQPGRELFLGLYAPGSADAFGAAYSGPTDTDLEVQTTGAHLLQSGITIRAVVRQFGLTVDSVHPGTGPYTIQLRLLDRRPEHVPQLLVPGDTVDGERIDYIGDVDEFTLPVAANQSYNLFFQGTSGRDSAVFQLLTNAPLPLYRPIYSNGTAPSLVSHHTGRFTAPATGSYDVAVSTSTAHDGLYRGAYRLFPYLIDPLPETAPAAITLGDSVLGESLDLPGDLDRITLTVPQATAASIVLWRPTGTPLGPVLSMPYQLGTIQFVTLPDNNGGPEAGEGSSRFPLAAGTYTVEIRSDGGDGEAYTGGYRLETFAVDSAPEASPPLFAIGDTVTEAIDVDGDLDEFRFDYVRGQQLDFQFQGTGPPSALSFVGWLTDSAGNGLPVGLGTEALSGTLANHRTGRFELPADGQYRLFFSGGSNGTDGGEVAGYRFTLKDPGVLTEHGISTLAPGDTATGERIDSLGDMDEFLLSGAPGDEVVFLLASAFSALIEADLLPLGSATPIARLHHTGGITASAVTVLPAAGQLRLRIGEQRSHLGPSYEITDAYHTVGAYNVALLPVARAPEVVSPVIALGDTIAGESLSPQGDIDEFTFTGTAGVIVTAYLNTPAGFPGNAAVLEVLEPGTGNVLGSVSSGNSAPNLTDQSTGPIVLPAAGIYTVRISQRYTHPTNCPYVFMVR